MHAVNQKKKKQRKYIDSYNMEEKKMIDVHAVNQKKTKKVHKFLQYERKKNDCNAHCKPKKKKNWDFCRDSLQRIYVYS